MPTLSPTVLLLGSFAHAPLAGDAIRSNDTSSLPENLELSRIDVIAADIEFLVTEEMNHIIRCQSPRVAQIITKSRFGASDLTKILSVHNELNLYAFIEDGPILSLDNLIIGALEKARRLRQRIDLQQMVQQQGHLLQSSNEELERRAEIRQSSLVETRRKNMVAKYRWETLKKALEAIHKSFSVSEIEMNLSRVLQDTMNLLLVKIRFSQTLQNISQNQQLNSYSVTLFRSHENPIGEISFIREKNVQFLREEKEFLGRIAEAVALAIDRVHQLELAESFREQWQATFNAVSDPVALIDQDFRILQANSSFNKNENTSARCYERLFQRTQPCSGCRLGQKFRLIHENQTLDVFSQPALQEPGVGTIYVNHYQDISDQIQIERRLAESAKLAELGTIGSSIAHELNNPLGGLLSYLQLIRMDLPKQSPMLPDLEEMERGAIRCRDIIQNLLGFTRTNSLEGAVELDLRKVITKVCGILDLQLKSRGIRIKFQEPVEPILIQGHLNLLAQAFLSLIQGHFVRISHSLPHLEISINVKDSIEVQILDNSPDSQATTEIQNANISISQQIFKDHGASVEIDHAQSRFGSHVRLVKISFQKIDNKA